METDKAAKIKRVFTDLNRKFEEEDTQRKAVLHHFPYFDLTGFPIEEAVLSLLPRDRAETSGAIPFFREGPVIKLGITKPNTEDLSRLIESLKKQKYQPELYLVSGSAFQAAMAQYKKIIEVEPAPRPEVVIKTGAQALEDLRELVKTGERLQEIGVTQILEKVLGAAIAARASDVHFESEKKSVKIRFRIDGVLEDAVYLPSFFMHTLFSRIKLLAGMKLNVNVPQDGRFSVQTDQGRNIDLRTSNSPSAYGESIVIRILGGAEIELDINQLGLRGQALELVRNELKKPNGMILTTGPTGSGKTTTLYSFLKYLNRPGIKIITLEDPVEYRLEGIIQTPIDSKQGLDFSKGLRSILRQDPDVVMVGEVRDLETAETAAQAALTGHVVLSTMHTNDAAGAIPRLLDLGIKAVTLAPALNALLAQRLVRKICLRCKEVYRPKKEELDRVNLILAQVPSGAGVKIPERLVFYHSPGCPACHDLGYLGRTGIFEAFSVDEKVQELIYHQGTTLDIKKRALEQGMLTMQQDGILKALEGVTDLAEVWRVTEE